MKDIKIALIGCGRIGFLLEKDPLRYKPCTHYGGIKAAGLKVSYACDIDKARLTEFANTAKIPEKNTYTDYSELILTRRPEMVVIATWTATHAEIGILAAMNGAKTIICEKPVSDKPGHARALIEECRKRGIILIVNHERRYDARYAAVKKLLESGKIGEVKTVIASILTHRQKGKTSSGIAGAPLLHDGTHMIDIIRYLFGDISSVTGETHYIGKLEDRTAAWLKTESGIDIFLEAGGSRNYFVFELQISGTDGKIVIGNGYQQLFLNKKSRYYAGFKDLSEKPFPKINGMNYFTKEYTEAKNTFKGSPAEITSSGEDGYRALEVIQAIYLSSRHGNKKIDLPVKPAKFSLKKIFRL